MSRKTGLGRGLDALIEASRSEGRSGINLVPVENISSNPRQPRAQYNPETLQELADSIRQHGIIQPLVVTYDPSQPDNYILIAGERRLQAATQAGLQAVPVIIRDASDQERLELALIENLQRADLNPLEEADAYRQLVEDFELTHEEIANRVAKSRSEVTNTLRLLTLAQEVKDALLTGSISKAHARALVTLPNWQSQSNALNTVLEKDLSVRQTEDLVKRLSGHRPVDKGITVQQSPEIVALEDRLRGHLGAKVNIKQYSQGGSIIIRYYSDEELNDVLERFLGQED